MKEIKSVVSKFNKLCKNNKFKESGEFSRSNKYLFVEFVRKATVSELLYSYKVCHIFNMTQSDCFNLNNEKL